MSRKPPYRCGLCMVGEHCLGVSNNAECQCPVCDGVLADAPTCFYCELGSVVRGKCVECGAVAA